MLSVINHGRILELRLDHPPVNALRLELLTLLREAVERAPGQGIGAVVISGLPGYFSVGLDLRYHIKQSHEATEAVFHELFALLRTIGTSSIPVAAAITGHCPGGGMLISAYCDYRAMADGPYKIGLNEVQIGLPIPPIIYSMLTRLVGPRQAERLCVEGPLLRPQEAESIGLVDKVVPPPNVLGHALGWCRGILQLPPRAMRITRAAARMEIARAFAEFGWEELEELARGWSNRETQHALRTLVARMDSKAKR